MFNKLLSFSIQQRWLVLLCVLGIGLLGVFHFQSLPIDAVPDITNVQVQINTQAAGYAPLEVEQQITFPIEFSLSGLPKMKQTRSLSRYGLSQVTVIFEEGTDIYFARQLLSEKLQQIQSRLPQGLQPELGPIATGLGEIYMWALEAKPEARNAQGKAFSLTDLRTLQDWVVRPQLKTVPGVTEVNTIGGYPKMFQISPDPEKMRAYQISFEEVVTALQKNNQNTGAGYIEREGSQYLLRMPGKLKDENNIQATLIKTENGVPVRIRDVAQVEFGQELRTGAATYDGQEAVLGTAVMLIGANSQAVSEAVHERLLQINESLPKGVQAVTLYNRSVLVEKTIATVEENLALGALFVIVVLFLFLGNFRAAVITAMVIPFAMCFTISGMYLNKISANLMSLGALDFGIIVDGSVVMAENCLRHLAHQQQKLGRTLTLQERMESIWEASREARQALLFGELIIMVVYVPILALEGVEGKMFHPMALTVILALLGAMILSMTFVPAALTIFMRGKVSEKENWLMRQARQVYQPVLRLSLAHRPVILSLAIVLVAICGVLSLKMGREFIPNLNEGDAAVQVLRATGTGLDQSIKMQKQLEVALKKVSEVSHVFSRIGTAEVATDPMPPNIADTFVIMKPQSDWPNPKLSRADLLAKVQEAIADLPGNNYEFTQPIQMRFNELLSGVRADLAIKIYGDDMDQLLKSAQEAEQILSALPGVADLRVEQVSGLPILSMMPQREALGRYGLATSDVQSIIEIAGAGKLVGEIFEGDQRFDIMVRLPEYLRKDVFQLKQLPVPRRDQPGSFVPLNQVAEFENLQGPNQISRENGKRRIVISANIRGRDLGSFVTQAQSEIKQKLNLPTGYWVEWGGEFEKLRSAAQRLQIVVPVALVLILLLLNATLKSIKDTLLVFSGVPLALTGGILALALRGLPLSISAGVGFIALSGVAVLNGLVMLTFISQIHAQQKDLSLAIFEGASTRLRPVLMTALVASLGFIPMALSTGTGAEVQRPLATVVIGGVLSSTLLTLIVLPVLYSLVHQRAADKHLRPESALPALPPLPKKED
jgi:heavy metal efflux system protein